jgi:hypothetical protein
MSSASSSVMPVYAKMAGGLLGWFGIFNKARAKDTNLARRTEWDGDLELLLVKDKDILIAKVGTVSAPVVMDLLAVVLG